jgi:two-component system OmpR family sensor kinase
MSPSSQSLTATLERLLDISATDLRVSLSQASDVLAQALGADKVDAFLYDPTRDTFVAVGTSNQPLSALQKRLGLDVIPAANGGRVVHVFRTGETFVTGRLDQDPEELRGVKEALGVRSELGVPLEVGGRRGGVLMICSQTADRFTADDVRFVKAVVRWVGIIGERAELSGETARRAHQEGRRAAAEELITVLAHDLRNLLAPVSITVTVIKQRAARDGREAEVRDATRMEGALSRIWALIADILDVARIDRGLLHIDPRPIDLVPLVRETAATLGRADRPVLVEAEGSEAIIVAADAARVRQCLENLIANALEHSLPHGKVTVTIRREPQPGTQWVRVDVVDEGPGIAADMLPHIFDRFVSAKPGDGGLGLGLYLARGIATSHGGDLVARSLPGKGACFSLRLPAGDAGG